MLWLKVDGFLGWIKHIYVSINNWFSVTLKRIRIKYIFHNFTKSKTEYYIIFFSLLIFMKSKFFNYQKHFLKCIKCYHMCF
jgi:hypothetical protein